MTLPAPHLDDRRFQDLVDDAKRLVQQRCPEWTDHNVSDPGVTLIETFAHMVDQLVYRLNRVPDRHYIRFLDLVGLTLHPPAAAEADLTFWLSAPQPTDVSIPEGSEVATVRTETQDPVIFTVVEERAITACSLTALMTRTPEGVIDVVTDELAQIAPRVKAFQTVPVPDDELLVGLDAAVGGCVVRLQIDAEIEGVGVDPTQPPLRWEAWNGDRWSRCEVERDTTGGFNVAGEVILHVPRSHDVAVLRQQKAGWLRCRVVSTRPDQPAYSQSPIIKALSAQTIGATVRGVHAQVQSDEVLGTSEGVPGQQFRLAERPVVPGDARHQLRVGVDGEGWVTWDEVADFSLSGPDDRHFTIDHASGVVHFGPAVRTEDGSLRHHGAVPPRGATVQILGYRSGGGLEGNVSTGTLRVLRSAIPFVTAVENRAPASGGVSLETVDEAKARAPIFMRTRGRAVTFEDYEELTLEASPDIARARCIPATSADDGTVRVLVVPEASGPPEELRFEQLIPSSRSLERVATHLGERRMIGARVRVQPAVYQGVTVVAEVLAAPGVELRDLRGRVATAVASYVNPLIGGPQGRGWPFGRPLQVGEIYAALQAVRGVDVVLDARLFPADPVSGKRGKQASRMVLDPDTLLFGFEHQIRVIESEE